jgi:predicted RNase H-like nuclease (RuvC/YqgF family)
MCIMSKTSNIIAKIKELFAEEKMATDYTAATGEIIRCLGDGLKVGEKVVQIAAEKEASLPDGNYLLDNGKSITVAAGEIKEINEYNAENKPNEIYMEKDMEMGMGEDKMAEYKNEIASKLMDGTEVKILSKGDALSVGDEVMVKDAEGNFVPAPEGKHELEGGLVIYTDVKGFINELETKETEEEDDREEEMKTMFEAVSTMKSIVDELKSTISDLKNENKELKERFNKFAAEPSVETITKKTENLSKTAKKEDKLKFFGGK